MGSSGRLRSAAAVTADALWFATDSPFGGTDVQHIRFRDDGLYESDSIYPPLPAGELISSGSKRSSNQDFP